MLFSKTLIPTTKEDPKEAEVISHKLMVRAGYIRRLASGIYTWLPVGLRSLRKVENIVREEMNKKGAQEIIMPFVQPKELWMESKRWTIYGKELLRFKDRNGRELCLAPTHEEVVTDLVRREVRSYKGLPLTLYQIQTKFRDEIRPRFGVMRAREFLMKDAYSFDIDEGAAEKSYMDMYDAYTEIFKRCGLRFRPVEADTGQIGGSFSHEFMVLADTGEDTIISCEVCGYAANLEKAEVGRVDCHSPTKKGKYKKVKTPNMRRVEEVASFLHCTPDKLVKTLIYHTDKGIVGVLVRGDREVNETKLKNLLGVDLIELASEATIEEVTGGPLGFSGPLGLDIPLYADNDIIGMEDFVTGGNERDVHLIDMNPGDIAVKGFYDLKLAREGDICPRCGGALIATKGIEVGHIFKLGLKYSKAMNAVYLDRDGKERYMVMGCYGIGIGRTVAAAIEQGHDDNGIIMPMAIAPFEVDIVPVDHTYQDGMELSARIYKELFENQIDVILDDRPERPGVKFKDCDLIGIPIRVTIGERNLREGNVEFKTRENRESIKIKQEEITRRVIAYVREVKSS